MKVVRWATLAQQDVTEKISYYREVDGDLADDFLIRLIEAAAFVADYPHAGPMTLRGNRRKWRVKKTPFLLIYRPTVTELRILRVLHDRQD